MAVSLGTDGAGAAEAPALGLLELFRVILERDLRVGLRRWSDASNSALFFILVVTLFPLNSINV